MIRLRHLEALPTWALSNMMILFVPRSHPWFNRWFPLAVWAEHRSFFSRQMDVIIWMWLVTYEITWLLIKYWPGDR